MKSLLFAVFASLALAAGAVANPAPQAQTATPDYIKSAINDSARKADRHKDQRRQMAAVMTFTQVQPGDVVVELIPGSGYWTRVFSRIVGAEGHVYTIWPKAMMKYAKKSYKNWQQLVKTEYPNVSLLKQPASALSVPAQADLVFTSQNYHDYHNILPKKGGIAAFNKKIYKLLKPGGYYVLIDHVAPAGSGAKDTDTLHRIDPAKVKKEVEAAGFVFDAKSDALSNPDDPHDISVFDKSVRGYTDQFIFRFKKPAK